MEEVPRFALLKGAIDDFIDEQEKKHKSKIRQRSKPAKTLFSKKDRAQECWRNTSCSTHWIAERVNSHSLSEAKIEMTMSRHHSRGKDSASCSAVLMKI